MSLSSNRVKTSHPSLTPHSARIGELPPHHFHLCMVGCVSTNHFDIMRLTPLLGTRIFPGQRGPRPPVPPWPSSSSRRPSGWRRTRSKGSWWRRWRWWRRRRPRIVFCFDYYYRNFIEAEWSTYKHTDFEFFKSSEVARLKVARMQTIVNSILLMEQVFRHFLFFPSYLLSMQFDTGTLTGV